MKYMRQLRHLKMAFDRSKLMC